jgi:AcrR family transcriptional regulator
MTAQIRDPDAPAVTGDERRRQLIETAAELFDSRGYHRTSVEDVAEACGIRKPTLYHYFSSKDEILRSIHDEFIDLLIERQDARVARGLNATEIIFEVMRDVLDLMRTHRGYVRVFFEHHRDLSDDSRDAIRAKRDRYQASIEQIFVRGAADGELRDVDPRLATLVLAGMCNWAYQWYQPDGVLSSEQIARQFCSILVEGLEAGA